MSTTDYQDGCHIQETSFTNISQQFGTDVALFNFWNKWMYIYNYVFGANTV